MSPKIALQLLFAGIFVTLLTGTVAAGWHQPLWQWGGLNQNPDRWWTLATLLDAYGGFLTFYAWLFYKERAWSRRIGWFIAIMALGNLAMSSYMLWQLARLKPGQPLTDLLVRH